MKQIIGFQALLSPRGVSDLSPSLGECPPSQAGGNANLDAVQPGRQYSVPPAS